MFLWKADVPRIFEAFHTFGSRQDFLALWHKASKSCLEHKLCPHSSCYMPFPNASCPDRQASVKYNIYASQAPNLFSVKIICDWMSRDALTYVYICLWYRCDIYVEVQHIVQCNSNTAIVAAQYRLYICICKGLLSHIFWFIFWEFWLHCLFDCCMICVSWPDFHWPIVTEGNDHMVEIWSDYCGVGWCRIFVVHHTQLQELKECFKVRQEKISKKVRRFHLKMSQATIHTFSLLN